MATNENYVDFGPRLKKARVAAGLTLEGVATALGTSFTTIWRYEATRHRPSGKTIFALASLYQVSMEWLIGQEHQSGATIAETADRPCGATTRNEADLALTAASPDLSQEAIRWIADYIRFVHPRELRERRHGTASKQQGGC